jgi:hypothetical protein
MSNSNLFGDYEPEDAWDYGDDKEAHTHNLWLRIKALDGGRTNIDDYDLAAIVERVNYWRTRRGTLDTRATLRLDQLIEDLAVTIRQV